MHHPQLTHLAHIEAARILQRAGRHPVPPLLRVCDVKCGRWSHRTGNITLPAWLWLEDYPPDFVEWYVAHELAHALNGVPGHGLPFQLTLWSLAPNAWHWETTYKARQYARAHACIYGTPGI